jgi:hypothetical protein
MATSRADSYALAYIPEATYGVDPGIVAAPFVDGETETYSWVPQAGATPLKAWLRLSAAPSNLPTRAMTEAPQLYPIADSDGFFARGHNTSDQEFTIEMLMHGGALNTAGMTDNERPVPPPWQQLITSAAGRTFGHRATDAGGGNGPTNKSIVAATPAPNASYFKIEAGPGTVGALASGMPFLLNHAVQDWEMVRPTLAASGLEFGNTGASTSGALYNGTSMGAKAAPTTGAQVRFASTTAFDRRQEDHGSLTSVDGPLSFTLLVYRGETKAACILKGARVKGFEITEEFNDFAKISISFIYKSFHYFGEDPAAFSATPTIIEEPAYYATAWPCPRTAANNHLTLMKYIDSARDGQFESAQVVRDIAITGMSIAWQAGWTTRHSLMAASTVEDLRLTEKQSLTVKFTMLYDDDFRTMLGLCPKNNGAFGFNSFPLVYWSGTKPADIWGIVIPAAFVKEDPGTTGDHEGNTAMQITLGWRPFFQDKLPDGNQAPYAYNSTAQHYWSVNTFGS